MESLQNLIAVRRPAEKRYIVHEAVMQKCWQLYETGIFDVPKFLSCANHILRAHQTLLITDTAEVDYFIDAPVHDISKFVTH